MGQTLYKAGIRSCLKTVEKYTNYFFFFAIKIKLIMNLMDFDKKNSTDLVILKRFLPQRLIKSIKKLFYS